MVAECLRHRPELPAVHAVDLVIPPSKVQPCHILVHLHIEYVRQFHGEVVCGLELGVKLEDDVGAPSLRPCPLRGMLCQNVFSPSQQLLASVAVGVAEGSVRHALFSAAVHLPVLHIPSHPPERYAQIVDGVVVEFVYMETVVCDSGLWERAARYEHHRRREVERYLPDGLASGQGNSLQHRRHRFGFSAADGGDKRASAAVGVAVGDEGVKLPAAERRLVDGQVGPDVLREQDELLCMRELLPSAVAAEYFFVLARQSCPFHAVMRAYGAYALWRRLNPYLLKKPRTRESGGCLPRSARSRM